MPKASALLQGTLHLLVLKAIARDPLHGWAIAKRILEQQGWIDAKWNSDLGRQAKSA